MIDIPKFESDYDVDRLENMEGIKVVSTFSGILPCVFMKNSIDHTEMTDYFANASTRGLAKDGRMLKDMLKEKDLQDTMSWYKSKIIGQNAMLYQF